MQIGSFLGSYKILDELGSGGMGDVYLALDTKLDRKVAIKLLPQDLSDALKKLPLAGRNQ